MRRREPRTMSRTDFVNQILPMKNQLFGHAFRFLQNREEARDVVQDVLLKVWEKNGALDEIKNLEAWCMTMVKNRSLDRLKRKETKNVSLDDQFNVMGSAATPSQCLEKEDLLQHMRKIVSELPAKQKTVIRLRDFEERTYEEMVEETGWDMNVVKVTLFRARKTIKERMLKITNYGI